MYDVNSVVMAKEGDDGYDVKNVHETFAEKTEVLKIIESLKEIQGDMIPCERAMERFTSKSQRTLINIVFLKVALLLFICCAFSLNGQNSRRSCCM